MQRCGTHNLKLKLCRNVIALRSIDIIIYNLNVIKKFKFALIECDGKTLVNY